MEIVNSPISPNFNFNSLISGFFVCNPDVLAID